MFMVGDRVIIYLNCNYECNDCFDRNEFMVNKILALGNGSMCAKVRGCGVFSHDSKHIKTKVNYEKFYI